MHTCTNVINDTTVTRRAVYDLALWGSTVYITTTSSYVLVLFALLSLLLGSWRLCRLRAASVSRTEERRRERVWLSAVCCRRRKHRAEQFLQLCLPTTPSPQLTEDHSHRHIIMCQNELFKVMLGKQSASRLFSGLSVRTRSLAIANRSHWASCKSPCSGIWQ